MGLLDMIFGGSQTNPPPNAPPKQSTANAAQNLRNRQAYLQHVTDAQSNGDTPMTYDQWVTAQQAKQPQK